MLKKLSILGIVPVLALFGLFLGAGEASAGACFSQPIVHMTGTGTINSAVYGRSGACVENTTINGTFSAGQSVTVHAMDDGWYEVSNANGLRGWIWGSFVTVNASATGEVTEPSEPKVHEEKKHVEKEYEEPKTHTKDASLVERMKGRILLQVEDLGKAHYVHPDSGDRYYMKDGPTAYEMMRAFGLGITNSDLDQIPEVSDEDGMLNAPSICASNDLAARLKGKILLQVEGVGQAFYIHPDKCRRIYMKDGATAYQIMRKLSLGITDKDIKDVPSKEFQPISYEDKKDHVEKVVDKVVDTVPAGEVPSDIDIVALNDYWLDRVNELRAERGLRQLVIDDRWQETANEYAYLMKKNGWFDHQRDGGISMHDWIDKKGLDFTERYSVDGWNENYFTENISWGYVTNSHDEVIDVLDDTMDFFRGEVDWNGPHYRTIYHEDWNSVGLGFYFKPTDAGTYKVYIVMHYGSLEL